MASHALALIWITLATVSATPISMTTTVSETTEGTDIVDVSGDDWTSAEKQLRGQIDNHICSCVHTLNYTQHDNQPLPSVEEAKASIGLVGFLTSLRPFRLANEGPMEATWVGWGHPLEPNDDNEVPIITFDVGSTCKTHSMRWGRLERSASQQPARSPFFILYCRIMPNPNTATTDEGDNVF
uniref:SCP domain-containing protein n=1 Tax=Mesocestoides corti TaxID=53468 RepID=A0A5K3FE72_MESCO